MRKLSSSLRAACCGTALALLVQIPPAAAQTGGAVLRVNTYTAGDQQSPAAARDAAGNSVVVWESHGQDARPSGIYGQRLAADGTALGGEFRVGSFNSNLQFLPVVAMSASGAFVVAWQSSAQDGNGVSVRAQLYSAGGAPLGPEFKVNTSTQDLAARIGIGMDALGNFAVAWAEHTSTLSVSLTKTATINARLYIANGAPRGAPIQVASTSFDALRAPALAMNGGGAFVVVWDALGRGDVGTGPGGLGVGVRARRFAADGTALGLGFTVNAYDPNVVLDRPVVAMDARGGFVAAWEALGLDLHPLGVHARRYGADGKAAGNEFTAGDPALLQHSPAIAAAADGSFAIAGHGDGVYAQRYQANGAAQGGSFRLDISTLAHDSVLSPAVALDSGGGLLAAWQDFQADGDGRGIAARIFQP